MMLVYEISGEFIIGAVRQDKLEFVVRFERFEIIEGESVRLARMRAFHIDDFDDLLWNSRQGAFAAGFEKHFVAASEQTLHERYHFALLQHGFAAGDFYQAVASCRLPVTSRCGQLADFGED